MTFLPKDDLELDLNNEKPNTDNSTLNKKSLNDREYKRLQRTTHPETVKEIRKKDNKENYEKTKEKILQQKRELYKNKSIARDKLKKEIEKSFESIPKDLLMVDTNSINLKNTKFKITYTIKFIP